ncbi:hypothetical protein BV20DRAFT_724463 [Pilatotrama ljubarskyi]|nr:hypothetical protein BV20DRAFT_724463 [Pilatotrama ljubarskyi]
MSSLEFVIESPESTRQNKKRPRLVTSCDNCRVKKIKCIQQPSTGSCEACTTARIPCLYRDREQYFAERTRLLTGATTTLPHVSSLNQTTLQDSPTPSSGLSSLHTTAPCTSVFSDMSPGASTSATYDPQIDMFAAVQGQSQALSGEVGEQMTSTIWHNPLQTSPPNYSQYRVMHLGTTVNEASRMPPSSTSPQLSGLFDPSHPTQPHPTLMVDFIRVFFDKLTTTYPFLSLEIVRDQFIRHRLSPLLANCIAASAARYSTMPEIHQIGSANVADVYCQMAKALIPSNAEAVSLDDVHALVLLSWAECQRGRTTTFNTYAGLAIRFATQLGISNESTPQLMQILDPRMASMLRATLQAIQFLKDTSPAEGSSNSAPFNLGTSTASHGSTLWDHMGTL